MKRLFAIISAFAIVASPGHVRAQSPANGGVQINVVTLKDLTETSVTYCSLGQTVAQTGTASATASNTVTSSAAFGNISVGDEVTFTKANATPPTFVTGITAKASSSSMTAQYRNPLTLAASTMTFSGAAFSSRKLTCSDAANAGSIPVNYGPYTITITVWTFNVTGTIDWNIQCRSSAGAQWAQRFPVLAANVAGPTYSPIGAAMSQTFEDDKPYSECRLGMWINGSDTGTNHVSVNASRRSS